MYSRNRDRSRKLLGKQIIQGWISKPLVTGQSRCMYHVSPICYSCTYIHILSKKTLQAYTQQRGEDELIELDTLKLQFSAANGRPRPVNYLGNFFPTMLLWHGEFPSYAH